MDASPSQLAMPVYFKKIIEGVNTCVSLKMVTYFDSWFIASRGLVLSQIKSHLFHNRSVEYLCFSHHPRDYKEILLKCNINPDRLSLKDYYSDPFTFLKKNKDESLRSFIRKSCEQDSSTLSNTVVVIDRVDSLAKYFSVSEIVHMIHALKQDELIIQLILLSDQELISDELRNAVDYLTSARIILSAEKLHCNIQWKQNSGKVINSNEEFTLDSNLSLQMLKQKVDQNSELEEDSDTELAHQTTFNLSLTEDQKRAKENLILPYTRIQNNGGQIHYVPDRSDDWDDEDPDEDLEI